MGLPGISRGAFLFLLAIFRPWTYFPLKHRSAPVVPAYTGTAQTRESEQLRHGAEERPGKPGIFT